MKSNEDPEQSILSQIQSDPLLKDAEIAVRLSPGEIILSGTVNKFFKKALICKIARSATRIKNITDRIEVVLANPIPFDDEEIRKSIVEKYEKNFGNSYKNIVVKVIGGAVILEGSLLWKYQKLLATECISFIEGIRSIQNDISTNAINAPQISEKDILAAIYKEEYITADINVDLNGHRVIITGNVPTALQKKLVEKIVRAVPGVEHIESRLKIVKK